MGVPDDDENTRQGRISKLMARLTSQSRDVLATAADVARIEGASVLDTRDLLLALATDPQRLKLIGVTMGTLREASKTYGKSHEKAPVAVVWGSTEVRPPLTFTDTVIGVIEHALHNAMQADGTNYVGPEHLMGAMAEHSIDAVHVLTKATGETGVMARVGFAAAREVMAAKEMIDDQVKAASTFTREPTQLSRFLVELMATVPVGVIEAAITRAAASETSTSPAVSKLADEFAKRVT